VARHERVSWHFALADLGGDWSWMDLGPEKLKEVRRKLCNYESQTIGQLVSTGGNHGIETSEICKEARQRLLDIQQDDLDKLWSLHLTNTERVWGVIKGSVFSLLWWDPNHTVYPVEKKRT
jgi:hypothetical protein